MGKTAYWINKRAKRMLYIYPAYFLSEQTSVMNGGQVSVVDSDELVQILRLLYLVLKF